MPLLRTAFAILIPSLFASCSRSASTARTAGADPGSTQKTVSVAAAEDPIPPPVKPVGVWEDLESTDPTVVLNKRHRNTGVIYQIKVEPCNDETELQVLAREAAAFNLKGCRTTPSPPQKGRPLSVKCEKESGRVIVHDISSNVTKTRTAITQILLQKKPLDAFDPIAFYIDNRFKRVDINVVLGNKPLLPEQEANWDTWKNDDSLKGDNVFANLRNTRTKASITVTLEDAGTIGAKDWAVKALQNVLIPGCQKVEPKSGAVNVAAAEAVCGSTTIRTSAAVVSTRVVLVTMKARTSELHWTWLTANFLADQAIGTIRHASRLTRITQINPSKELGWEYENGGERPLRIVDDSRD